MMAIRVAAALVALIATASLGCRPAQCGARNEPCCGGRCLAQMTCISDVCRAPCAGPLDACDAVTGTGCPDGSVCRLEVRGETIVPACEPGVAGASLVGGACTSTRDCALGLWCYRSACRFLCCADDDDCADPLQVCVGFDGVGLCDGDDDCNIFTQTGCPEGQACHAILLESGGFTPSCFRPGTTGHGEPCARHGDCIAAHRCIDATGDDDTRCWPVCDGAHPCASGSCEALAGNPGFGFCPP